MYSHILLPVLLSDAAIAQAACQKARGLLTEGGKITLLHVVEPIPSYVTPYFPADVQMESMEAAKGQLKAMAEALGLQDTALIHGSVGRSIVDWAEQNDAECIVMASHQPVFADAFLGSTAAWVVRHAQASVLVLRNLAV